MLDELGVCTVSAAMRTERASRRGNVVKAHKVDGWNDYSEFNVSAPYTIVGGGGRQGAKIPAGIRLR